MVVVWKDTDENCQRTKVTRSRLVQNGWHQPKGGLAARRVQCVSVRESSFAPSSNNLANFRKGTSECLQ